MVATFTLPDDRLTSTRLFAVIISANNYERTGGSIIATAKWNPEIDGAQVSIFDLAKKGIPGPPRNPGDAKANEKQRNYPPRKATLEGATVRVEFDANKFNALGPGWVWTGSITADGRDAYLGQPQPFVSP